MFRRKGKGNAQALDIPPEIISQILQKVSESHSRTDLENCSLVSHTWYQQARRFLFSHLAISSMQYQRPKGDKSIASLWSHRRPQEPKPGPEHHLERRLTGLLKMVESDPDIPRFVRHVSIVFPTLQPVNASAHYFLELIQKLDGVATLDVRLNTRRNDSIGFWDPTPLQQKAEEAIRHLCSLPTLERLSITGGKLPFSIFLHSPALRSLTLSDIQANSQVVDPISNLTMDPSMTTYAPLKALTLNVDDHSIDSSGVAHLVPLFTRHHTRFFRMLTHLVVPIPMSPPDLKSLLDVVAASLTHLVVTIGAHGGRDLRFGHLENLRSLSVTYQGSTTSAFPSFYPYISRTLSNLPFHTLETIRLELSMSCRNMDSWHISSNDVQYPNTIDSLLAPYALGRQGRLRDVEIWVHQARCKRQCGNAKRAPHEALIPQLYDLSLTDTRIRAECKRIVRQI